MQSLSVYCDLHESEMPVYLLRNVTVFCNTLGFSHMTLCFDIPNLPLSTAHAMTAVVSNIKLWLNYRTMITLFVPIRVKILQYMCKLADQDLRSPATKSMDRNQRSIGYPSEFRYRWIGIGIQVFHIDHIDHAFGWHGTNQCAHQFIQ